MENINYLALVVASLSTLVVGFIWYHPKVFGTAWMKETGLSEEQCKNGNMGLIFGISVVVAFLAAFFIWTVVFIGGPEGMEHGKAPFLTFKHGALHGALLALFVILPVVVTNALFEQRSFKYMAIIVGYWLVSFTLMGGIINAWI